MTTTALNEHNTIQIKGYPENKVTINGWRYVRLTDSMVNALVDFMQDHEDKYAEVRKGERTATGKDVAFAHIDREFLDSYFIKAVEKEIKGGK